MDNKIKQLKEQLTDSQKIVFVGGAGVSTESGIPDFRSSEGLYMQESGTHVSAEQMISHTFYKRYPKEFFKYYFENLVFEDAEPNEAHRSEEHTSELQSRGHLVCRLLLEKKKKY